jgi:hypothetical protein
MTASLETLVVAAYVFAHSLPIPRPGPQGKITDAELIALAVAQASTGMPSDRQFLGMVAYRLPGWFPHLPDQSQYNRRLRRLVPQIVMVQLGLAELVASGHTRLADGTLISCANYAGCAAKSHFAGDAGYGYCPSKSRFYWGMRLVLVTDEMGVPVGYDLVAAGEGEREPLFRLAQAQCATVLFADKGFWGAEYQRTIGLIDVELVTPERHRLGERPPVRSSRPRSGSSSSLCSPTSSARCASKSTSPRHRAGSSKGSLNAYSPSPSACSSTPSSVAPYGRSSHLTGAKPTSGL